jgi:hypothetical protein
MPNPIILRRMSVPEFRPSQVAGLIAWYEADRISGVSADATAVASWTDLSGLGHHLVQATGAKQPLLKTAIVSGYPVVRFDGSNDFLQALHTQAQPVTVTIACAFATYVSGNNTVLDGGANNAMRVNRPGATKIEMFRSDGAAIGVEATTTPESWHVYSCVFDGSVGFLQVDNGAASATGAVGAAATAGLTLGSRGDGTAGFAPVDVYGLTIHAFNLSAGYRAQLARYFGRKLAVAVA